MLALARSLTGFARSFRSDESGQVAVIFGLTCFLLFAFGGVSLDLARAYQNKQKLSEVAFLTCQYATRPSVTSATGYPGNVTTYMTNALASQGLSGTPISANFSPGTTSPTPTPAQVSLGTNVPALFLGLINVQSIPVSAGFQCVSTASGTPPGGGGGPPGNPSPPTVILSEGFEATGCSGTCFYDYAPGVKAGQTIHSPTTSIGPTPTYVGSSGTKWYVIGYCVEDDAVGITTSTVPEGSHSAELDCDNGSNSAGNSSISTPLVLTAGTYELRWDFLARVDYPDYDPAYICGSAQSDVGWAQSSNSSYHKYGYNVSGTIADNQINVYFDKDSNGSPPTHTTVYGNSTLGGSNLIDVCVSSADWVERSVKITVTTAGTYWLSFAADGANNSFGGQIDNIRFCTPTCPNSVQDNFPAAWLPGNTTLFEDTFETPSYKTVTAAQKGDLTQSNGTSGTSASGWPNASATGWGVGATNQVTYGISGAPQGNQLVQFDGQSGNASASRPFLLVPGYYQISYFYRADEQFTSTSVPPTSVPPAVGSFCGPNPSAANISALTGSTGTATWTGTNLLTSTGSSKPPWDTNIVAMFMAHAQLASTPNAVGEGKAATYTNPPTSNPPPAIWSPGTPASSPSVPPNGINLASYNTAQPNALLDICGYSTGWQQRTVTIRITKTAYYWLTAAALGTADQVGGAIDDVKLTSLGGVYMTAPSGFVTIPVPSPTNGATINYTGFSFNADPLTP